MMFVDYWLENMKTHGPIISFNLNLMRIQHEMPVKSNKHVDLILQTIKKKAEKYKQIFWNYLFTKNSIHL